MIGERDLFGELLPARARPPAKPRGRPCHAPTQGQRDQVCALKAAGLNHLEIAAAIGITAPTLRLHYPDELNSNSLAWRRRLAVERGEDG